MESHLSEVKYCRVIMRSTVMFVAGISCRPKIEVSSENLKKHVCGRTRKNFLHVRPR